MRSSRSTGKSRVKIVPGTLLQFCNDEDRTAISASSSAKKLKPYLRNWLQYDSQVESTDFGPITRLQATFDPTMGATMSQAIRKNYVSICCRPSDFFRANGNLRNGHVQERVVPSRKT